MIHFKNHNSGFTLIEIMLTLFMVTALLSSILNVQDVVFTSVITLSRRLQRVFVVKEYLFNRTFDEDASDKDTQTIEQPPTTITFEQKAVSQKSSLHKLQDMVSLKTTASWKDRGKDRTYSMMTFEYQPEEDES